MSKLAAPEQSEADRDSVDLMRSALNVIGDHGDDALQDPDTQQRLLQPLADILDIGIRQNGERRSDLPSPAERVAMSFARAILGVGE